MTCIAFKNDLIVQGDSDGLLNIWDLKARSSRNVHTSRGWVKKMRFAPGKGNLRLLLMYNDGVDIIDLKKVGRLILELKSKLTGCFCFKRRIMKELLSWGVPVTLSRSWTLTGLPRTSQCWQLRTAVSEWWTYHWHTAVPQCQNIHSRVRLALISHYIFAKKIYFQIQFIALVWSRLMHFWLWGLHWPQDSAPLISWTI